MRRLLRLFVFPIGVLISLPLNASAAGTEMLVTTGAPTYQAGPFPNNKQNEPGVAIDQAHPNIVAAGANEEIDLELCHTPSGPNESPCPFTPGVGVSGIYLSTNSGLSWHQPMYDGLTARGCVGTTPPSGQTACPYPGPIGTLPWYYENDLASDGDPSLAFGPAKGPAAGTCPNGTSGSRLYYSNLTAKLQNARSEDTFRGFEALYVSRTDCPETAMVDGAVGKAAWAQPVKISPRSSSTTFKDKENIWADNAASSPFYGNVYVCWVDFRANGVFNGNSFSPEPVEVVRSVDGGTTWDQQQQISPADNTGVTGGRQGCTVRTDSNGVVYVFWEGFDIPNKQEVIFMSRSFDGGKKWEKQTPVLEAHDVGAFDPNQGDFTFDGVGGSRTDSFPIVDIANGAPSGAAAPNTIVMTWSDGRNGTPSTYDCCRGTIAGEEALVAWSNNRGQPGSWNTVAAQEAGDRPDFPAIAISPDGSRLYLTYMAFLQPWQPSAVAPPRLMQGVVRTAAMTAAGPGTFTTLHRGTTGDARGSSANVLTSGFLGDYDYAAATNTFGVAVWNDVRLATDCAAVDAYRQAVFEYSTGSSSTRPTAPNPDVSCAPTFGNSDIFSYSSAP